MATTTGSKRLLDISANGMAASNNMTYGGLNVATEQYVSTQVSNLISSAPGTLDTLNELAAALGDDPNFATTITNSIATKLDASVNPLKNATVSNDTITFTRADGTTFAVTTSDANTDTNYYLNGITRSGNTLTFSVAGTTNRTYTFGSAAWSATTAFDAAGSASSVNDRIDSEIIPLIDTKADASHTHSYLPLAGGTITGGLTISGSLTRGSYTSASQYHTAADNIVLKGNASGISGIFFESEKNGTNINHSSDFGFIQFHPYGTGTSGESNELIIGVSNDADDHVIVNAPNVNGFKFRTGASATDYTVYHSGNLSLATLGYTGATNANYITNNNQLTNGAGYLTQTEGDNRYLKLSGGTLYKSTNTSGTSGTTFLTVHNNVGSDISQQQSFVDFMFTDTNANFTPQVRIGAQVGRNADANTKSKEGAGAFVVYTGNGTDESGGGALSEAMRIGWDNKLIVQGQIQASGYNKTSWDTAYGWGNHASAGYLTSETYTAHEDTSTLSGAYGGNNNGIVIEDITVDSNGHVTAVGTRDLDGRFAAASHNHDSVYTKQSSVVNLGTVYFGASPDTAEFIGQLDSLGCLAPNKFSTMKVAWDYAGNSDLDTGSGTIELAGCQIDVVTDNSSRPTVTIIRPTTGVGGGSMWVYNDQGSGYSPGWRQIWNSSTFNPASYLTTSGKAADSNLLDGINSTSFLRSDANDSASGNITFSGTVTHTGNLVITEDAPTISFLDTTSGADDFYIHVNSHNFYVLRDTAGSNTVDGEWDSPHPLLLEGDTNKAYIFGNEVKSAAYAATSAFDSAGSASNAQAAAIQHADDRIENEVLPAIPTDNSQLANGAGYVTSSGNTIIGTDTDINTSGYDIIDNLYMTDGVITSHGTRQLQNLRIPDTRSAEKTPDDYQDHGISSDFTDEFGSLGAWHSGITLKGWHDGYAAWQLISGSNTSINNNLYFRSGVNASWGTMHRIWHSGDFSSTNIANWNSAYNNYITGISITGTTTKTITLTQRDGGTISDTFTDLSGAGGDGNDFLVNGTFDPDTEVLSLEVANQGIIEIPLEGTMTDTDTNTWRGIHDTPVNGATTTSISSNWAFDNVKTAVPANAVFTDNNTTYSAGTGLTLTGTTFNVTANAYLENWNITDGTTSTVIDNGGTVELKAGNNVSISNTAGVFTISATDTDTQYSVGDGGLTQKNFTTTLKNKLDGIASGADVTPSWVPATDPSYLTGFTDFGQSGTYTASSIDSGLVPGTTLPADIRSDYWMSADGNWRLFSYTSLFNKPDLGTAAAADTGDFAAASHTHSAADINTGTLSHDRLPNTILSGQTRIGKDTSNYIAIDHDNNNSIDFFISGVWVARMEADGDLHMKGDVIAFSDIFNP